VRRLSLPLTTYSMPLLMPLLGNSSPRLARSGCVRPGLRRTVRSLNGSRWRRCSLLGRLQRGALDCVGGPGAPRHRGVRLGSYALFAEGDNCPQHERQHECQDQALEQQPDDNTVSLLRALWPSGTIIEESCRHPADK
jgi:hypothetical protein